VKQLSVLSGNAPAWVSSVQAVCFGTGADGVPAPYGWGALVAGPLGMLAILLEGSAMAPFIYAIF